MRFEVPQFVDVEDKIIGPLTWKQFIYVAGGGGTLFLLYATLPFVLFLLFGIPFGLLAAGLAFYRVNNRPLALMLEAVVTYFGKSRLYIWKREEVHMDMTNTNTPSAAILPQFHANIGGKNNISAMSRQLEINALKK